MGWKRTISKVITKKNKFVKYKWIDSDEADDYFEFKIVVDDMTSDVSLITDFADDEEDFEEAKLLWETQVDNLRGPYFKVI